MKKCRLRVNKLSNVTEQIIGITRIGTLISLTVKPIVFFLGHVVWCEVQGEY